MAIAKGWELVVGLEVHCELATKTKIFCSCPNQFGDEPNTNICPVCLGLPGSLPVLNYMAVELAMRVGQALNCRVEPSIFHRKNYFYPDMPKDYQVSQNDLPINIDGFLDLPDGFRVGIERAHLEEDTGKTQHMGTSGRIHGADYSLVDYNRAGVPLLEIVTRPDIRTAEQAKAYVAELRSILVATGGSDGKMEEGSMRVDANVSVRKSVDDPYGTRCEIKNLNSLRSLVRAIEYEANRQVDMLTNGERIVQETRHWNEEDGRTSSMRSKEEAMDYRYFPEPDLVPIAPSSEWVTAVRESLGLMPADRRARLSEATGGNLGTGSDTIVAIVEQGLDEYVLAAVAGGGDARRAINRVANEIVTPEVAAKIDVAMFAKLLVLEGDAKLTATQAKQVLAEMIEQGGGDPETIVVTRGFEAMDSGVVETIVDALISAHPAEFERLKGGDAKVTGFFVGAAMKASGGKADGKLVTSLLRSRAGLASER